MESGQPIEETRKGCFTMIHRTQARASASRWIQRTMLLLFMIVPLTGAFSAAAAVETDTAEQLDALPAAAEAAAPRPRRAARVIALVGVDTPGDPGAASDSAGDSPAQSSGPFDGMRNDLGEDDDLSPQARRRARQRRAFDNPVAVEKIPDPLTGTQQISPEQTGRDATAVLKKMLKPRSDSWADWTAPLESLHECGEPRALAPCVPPPPCHPSLPPVPYDLIGVRGVPSSGPIYDGPCEPRTGTHDHCPHPHRYWLHDRFFDWFYQWK